MDVASHVTNINTCTSTIIINPHLAWTSMVLVVVAGTSWRNCIDPACSTTLICMPGATNTYSKTIRQATLQRQCYCSADAPPSPPPRPVRVGEGIARCEFPEPRILGWQAVHGVMTLWACVCGLMEAQCQCVCVAWHCVHQDLSVSVRVHAHASGDNGIRACPYDMTLCVHACGLMG